MSESYRAVGWNRHKRRYDLTLVGGVVAFLATYVGITLARQPYVTAETVLIRGLGLTAFVLLHVILIIGPLSRLDPRFLPFLYNRRHLGVTMGLLALAHGSFSIVQFHALGDVNPLVSVLTGDGTYLGDGRFPFQLLGLGALSILLLMAATSHDFWLATLTAPVWKALHMLVYAAYVLLVAHVALGALQAEPHPVYVALLAVGAGTVAGLHIAAAFGERARDRERSAGVDGYVDVCAVHDIPEDRAAIACVAGERVAVFRYDGRVSAVSNVCQHQNGPLGEGRILDGCITCPWHGYQYLPDTGASPPPFRERIPTFNVRIVGGRVQVASTPNPPGTRAEPATIHPVEEKPT